MSGCSFFSASFTLVFIIGDNEIETALRLQFIIKHPEGFFSMLVIDVPYQSFISDNVIR